MLDALGGKGAGLGKVSHQLPAIEISSTEVALVLVQTWRRFGGKAVNFGCLA